MNHENEFIVNNSNYRKLVINGLQTTDFSSNAISTTKYGVLTFVPLFLFEQFHNYTNCFFLLISIIQQFPEASSLGRYTTIIPLTIILAISAVKEILEDFQRHREDKKVNSKSVEVLKDFRWQNTEWKNIRVGDVVNIRNNEFFPADVLFLKGASETGICYIETVNLDGENNLKIRHHVPGITTETNLSELQGVVECDPPNELIYNFNGVLKIEDDLSVPLTADHILLRGATLRNTSWVCGLVIYTGNETKICKNSSHTRMKRSSVSALVNTQIIVLFVLFLTFSFFHWILFMLWNNNYFAEHWYLPVTKQRLTDGSTIVIGLVFGVIYSIVIPISLQVMQDLSRLIQGIFISNDLDMYYEQRDIPALVKTSSLNEDLGLVKYIFADKTGTLTKNILEFRCCSVQGLIHDQTSIRLLNEKNEKLDSHSVLCHFFVAMCVCPGVIPLRDGDEISYYASSPDQKALIVAARNFGCTLVQRSYNEVVLKIRDRTKRYEILSEFEFSSDRRRTSVIVRGSDNELILYVIGADEVILPRVAPANFGHREITLKHIDEFCANGLRSLCVAMASLKQIDFEKWYPSYREAIESLDSKDDLTDLCESRIVKNLTLLGATGVEDKLQDEVPETINALLEAGINIWMLTGDRLETAVNIGNACRLLSAETPLIKLNSVNSEKLRYYVNHYAILMGAQFGKPGNNYGLLVTGDSLTILLDSDDVGKFLTLMLSCRSVICCRTTPKQKALVVKYVQKQTKFVTLAVGDGANDVAMIQTASIGVGISGMEGLQAANAADYSVGQFKYLKKLLLVHGTWSYNRICKLIYFIYYKSVAIASIQFYYTAIAAWSGQIFFDRWAKMLYNVVLTGAPTLALGIFEQNLSPNTLMNNPYAYTRNKWFNMRTFSFCLLNAFLHSILLTWLSLNVLNSNVFWSFGKTDNYMIVGNVVYTSLITAVCLKNGLHTFHWTNVTILFLIGSEVVWMAALACLSNAWPLIDVGEDMPDTANIIICTPLFWFYFLFIIVAVLGVDFIVVVLYRIFREPIANWVQNSSVGNGNRLEIFT